MVFDLIELQHLPYLTIDKWSAIVTDDPMRYPEPNNYGLLDKICHDSSCGLTEWYGFFLFGKILRSYEDPYVLTQG